MEDLSSYLSIDTFLAKYPNIHPVKDPLLDPYEDKNFNDVIVTKKEFADLKLPKTETLDKPQYSKTGHAEATMYNHQKIITRFINSRTPYSQLLLYHEMGTGKTCTAVSVIEEFKNNSKNSLIWNNIDGAIICAKGSTLLKNFINELVFSCTDGRYIPANYEALTSYEKVCRIKKNISNFYEFHTFETFARELSKMTDESIRRRYSNKILVIDEVHHLREKSYKTSEDENDESPGTNVYDAMLQNKNSRGRSGARVSIENKIHKFGTFDSQQLNVYNQFHRLCHLVKESKILLMSGTVMKDDPSEFASVMNLILPAKEQLPTGKAFLQAFVPYYSSPTRLGTATLPSTYRLRRQSPGGAFVERAPEGSSTTGPKAPPSDAKRLMTEKDSVLASNILSQNSESEKLISAIRGRVSYLKAMASDVKKVFMGTTIPGLSHFIVFPLTTSKFQDEGCIKAYQRDLQEANIFISTRQALLFVFPDGSVGQEGFNKYVLRKAIRTKKGKTAYLYILKRELVALIQGSVTTPQASLYEEMLQNLAVFSNKYAHTIKTLLNSPMSKSFVYSEFVNGGGCILFAKILQLFGYQEATGSETTKGKRYALLTNQTASAGKIQKLIARFNASDNIDGEYISLIIGSKVISEGFTFKNIRNEFIFTPHWNYSETSQVIARGWRLGSHNELIARQKKAQSSATGLQTSSEGLQVSIYQYVTPVSNPQASVDLIMYQRSEVKDIAMKQIEHLVKIYAFDCPLTIDRNKITGYDSMRECEYRECEYTCDGTIGENLDISTYNIFYNNVKMLYTILYKYFRTNFQINFEQLQNLVPTMTFMEAIMSVKTLIDTSVPFINKYGHTVYLRIQNRLLFLTNDLQTRNNDIFAEYYNKNLLIKNGDSFNSALTQLLIDNIPKTILEIFKKPTYMRAAVATLPPKVQICLLQGCIEAEIKDIQVNKETRRQILDMFKGFYAQINEKWTVWLNMPTHGISVLNKTEIAPLACGGREAAMNEGQRAISSNLYLWSWEDVDSDENIENYIKQKRAELKNTPIGVLGVYNPHLNEFCLKEVGGEDQPEDLRKLVIGRRCGDWGLKELVDIIARRIKLDIPENLNFYEDLSLQELTKIVQSTKEKRAVIEADYIDLNTLRRVFYWSLTPRSIICNHIKTWLEERGLIEENFNCGTQKKQRKQYAAEQHEGP